MTLSLKSRVENSHGVLSFSCRVYHCTSPGSSTRDLFNDNSVGMSSGVNVTRLVAPLRNILSAGLTPHIVTGNIPIALSTAPHIGAFGFNNQPPRDMDEYRRYIAAVAKVMHVHRLPRTLHTHERSVEGEASHNHTEYTSNARLDSSVFGLTLSLRTSILFTFVVIDSMISVFILSDISQIRFQPTCL